MNRSTTNKRGPAGQKKHRPSYKPKIRWELLGLSNPKHEESSLSIDTIRAQVSTLTREGFGRETRTPEPVTAPKTKARKK
ncbi:MAG: hypothetical protein U0412_05805 [Nitrospira sp.]